MPRYILLFSFILLNGFSVFSQVKPNPDSTAAKIKKDLSGASGSVLLKLGRESRIKPANVGIDSSVSYSAKIIESQKEQGIITLTGDAEVKFKNVTIQAGKIVIRMNENMLIAEGVRDTTKGEPTESDSLHASYIDFPKFSDGKETMVGEQMVYNFKSEKGRILRGRTEFQKGYYFGDVIKRVDSQVFDVAGGTYTTCDLEEPHYHFSGKKMKVIVGDKVVAKPVVFFIGKIPIAIFPFALFPLKENGRQSGIIIPQYGSSPVEGRYLRNLGYYWATNEFLDMRFTMDFFEKTGMLFRGNVNYAKRYHYTGSISGSYTRKNFQTSKQRRWNLVIRHNQTIDENTTLNVDASFESNNNFYREFSNNRRQRLNRQIRSNATLTKRSGDGKNSLTVNLSQTRDIETGRDTKTLPQIRFSRNQSALIPFKEDPTGRTKKQQKWFNYLRYDYRGFLVNMVSKDSSNDVNETVNRRAEHRLNFSYTNPNKLFGVLSWNQSLRYEEDWFDRTKAFALNDSTNRFDESVDKGFAARHIFNYSTSLNTNIYGTFAPHIGPITAFRHTMRPSISFSYRPDFSNGFWGYFVTRKDTTGKEVKLDRFKGSGGSSTPRGELKTLGYRLTNLFQMKLKDGDKEKKIDLFNLDFSGGFNFAADSLKWQNLSTNFRATPRKNFNVSMNMTHSFYDFDRKTGRTVDRLLFNEKGIFNFLRLTRFQFDARWNLSAKKKSGSKKSVGSEIASSTPIAPQDRENPLRPQDRFAPSDAFSAFDIPWRATISFSYGINKFNPNFTSKTAYIDFSNVEVQLTKKWRIGYRLRYDIEKSNVTDQRISFYRDLHCWEARFDWNPSGIGKGYYFKINIKAPQLSDIKIENRGGTTSVFNPF